MTSSVRFNSKRTRSLHPRYAHAGPWRGQLGVANTGGVGPVETVVLEAVQNVSKSSGVSTKEFRRELTDAGAGRRKTWTTPSLHQEWGNRLNRSPNHGAVLRPTCSWKPPAAC